MAKPEKLQRFREQFINSLGLSEAQQFNQVLLDFVETKVHGDVGGGGWEETRAEGKSGRPEILLSLSLLVHRLQNLSQFAAALLDMKEVPSKLLLLEALADVLPSMLVEERGGRECA